MVLKHGLSSAGLLQHNLIKLYTQAGAPSGFASTQPWLSWQQSTDGTGFAQSSMSVKE